MKNKHRGRLVIAGVLIMLALAILACGGQVSAPAPAPTPVPASQQARYNINQIYDEALAVSAPIVEDGMNNKANLKGFAFALFAIAGAIGVSFFFNSSTGCMIVVGGGLLVSMGGFAIGHNSVAKDTKQYVYDTSHALANVAIGEGVDKARKEQANNFQYIAATLNGYGVEVLPCSDPVNHKADCSAVSNYYTVKEINHRKSCTTDEDGDETCTETHDDKYVSWFPFLVRYWISPATRAKYIFEGLYDFRCINPESMALEPCTRDEDGLIDDRRQPAIFQHADWRAPVGVEVRREAQSFFGTYDANRSVPKLWQDLADAQAIVASGGKAQTITGYFVGRYFHWGFAANSTWANVYDGPYNQLKALVELPGPTGQWYNYLDAQGRQVSMNTLLRSEDGNLATIVDPVFVGFDTTNQAVVDTMNQRAREFQGAYGPQKESINYVVVVNHQIVQALGGMENTTAAVMGWLQDESRWGLFRMPKNQTIVVVEADDNLTTFNRVDFETGLPFGNDLVKRDVRQSVTGPMPFDWQTLMGQMESTYTSTDNTANPGYNWGQKLNYEFSDMVYAGGIISILYKDGLPEFVDKFPQPDPNSDACTTSQVEHVGYQRYQMCNQQFLETTIQIIEDGRILIMNSVIAGSRSAVDSSGEGWLLFFAVIVCIFAGAFRVKAISL